MAAGMKLPRLAAVLLLALPGAGCRLRHDLHNAPGKYGSGVSFECTDGYTKADGPYRYENNQWGAGKAQGRYEQCLLERRVDGQKQRGWTWNFPGTDPSVFSYPEVIFGWKPWTGGKSTDRHLPSRVGDFAKLSIVYEVESQVTGSYNLAPEVWVVNRNVQSGPAAPRSISAEVMFWMDAGGAARPGGNIVGEANVGGVVYELWQMDGAGSNGYSWRLISFKSPTPQLKGVIDIPAFMRVLVDKKLVDPSHYIASVEFGNEVSGGTGTTWIKKLAVETAP